MLPPSCLEVNIIEHSMSPKLTAHLGAATGMHVEKLTADFSTICLRYVRCQHREQLVGEIVVMHATSIIQVCGPLQRDGPQLH
jgi:hypothetical protein